MSIIKSGTTSTTAYQVEGNTNGDLVFQTNGTTTAMTINTSQNVGIGTSSPGQRLEVAGNIFVNTSGNPYMEVKTSGAGNNPYLRLTADTNNWTIQGTFSNANDELFFMNNSNTRMAITAGGDVGIGTTTPTAKLNISGTSNAVGLGLTGTHSAGDTAINIAPASAITGAYNAIYSYPSASTGVGYVFGNSNTSSSSAHSRVDVLVGGANGGDPKITYTVSGVINWCIGVDNSDSDKFKISASDAPGTSDVVTITSGGELLVGKTTTDFNTKGLRLNGPVGQFEGTADGGYIIAINRLTNDGDLITFSQAGTQEGTISVSGNTVSYNAFAGSHWSQLQDGSKPDILRGTVMESINELCVWPGEQNERLPKAKISDTAGSKKVYGVFMAWDNDWTATNDMYVTAVGAFICRVNGSVTVQEGDLLESNGDGTARVQADDIIRSSTIGKVTSTVKTHEYDDGSYCVPTVLYCG